MVFDGKSIAALGVDSSDVLFYFFESTLNFPASGVKFNHLFRRQINISGDQRKSKAFVVNKHNLDPTSERLRQASYLGKLDFSVLAVDMNHGRFCGRTQLSREFFDRSKLSTEFLMASTLFWNNFRKIVENGRDAQPGQYVNVESDHASNFLKQRFCSEPAVANNQSRSFKVQNKPDYQLSPDAGFGPEPLRVWQFGAGLHGFRKRQIEFLRKWQTSPTTMAEEQQSSENSTVPENPLGRVFFSRMVEVVGATSYFLPVLP